MPCIDAIDKKALILKETATVGDALSSMKKGKTTVALVTDEEGKATGFFSLKGLMHNLMPVSLPMVGGPVSLITLDAAPGVAKRLRRLTPLTVGEVMDRRLYVVAPSARLIDAMRHMLESGAPAVVVEDENNSFLGLITEFSVIERMENADAG